MKVFGKLQVPHNNKAFTWSSKNITSTCDVSSCDTKLRPQTSIISDKKQLYVSFEKREANVQLPARE